LDPPDCRSPLILIAVPLLGINSITGEPLGTKLVPVIDIVAPASGMELGVTEVIVGSPYQLRVAFADPDGFVTTNGYEVPCGSDGATNVRVVPVLDVTAVLTPLMVRVELVKFCPLTVTTVPVVLANRLSDGVMELITGPETELIVGATAVPTPDRS
jgi:hypothetical protein